jgi:uncharacterized SAM-binding protein YcdF (DUF218 family)
MRALARFILVPFMLFVLWAGGLALFARDMAAMDPPPAAPALDAVVVLTGGAQRVSVGFDLLGRGMGKKLFISGVSKGVEAKELMKLSRRETAEKIDCCITLGAATNTVENARETAAFLAAEGFRTVYLVTADYHMRRAQVLLEAVAPDVVFIPYPVHPAGGDLSLWRRDRAFSALVAREYTKYLVERARQFLLGGT